VKVKPPGWWVADRRVRGFKFVRKYERMMALHEQYDISGIELDDDSYTVVQGVFRNKYKALDNAGTTVLRGKQELFKLKEKFPFVDADGEEVFQVTASSIIDIAGDYILSDAATDEPVVILDNDFSLLQDTWTIRDPQTREALAEIDSAEGADPRGGDGDRRDSGQLNPITARPSRSHRSHRYRQNPEHRNRGRHSHRERSR